MSFLSIGLSHYLCVSFVLFVLGLVGMCLNRTDVIRMLMALEILLLSVSLNFIAFSVFLEDIAGQVFVFFILATTACETAVGLAILVVFSRNKGNISVGSIEKLKG